MPAFLRRISICVLATCFCLSTLLNFRPATAQDAAAVAETDAKDPAVDPGQNDLDEAVIKRIDAESLKDLEAVAGLIESALKKGLDDENTSFAKKMLGSIQLQMSQALAGGMMRARGPQQGALRDRALLMLDEAVKNDPALVEAYLLIARLNMLPNGDTDAIREATTKAIELLDDDPVDQSAAYVLRALTQTDDEKKMADLNAAVETDSENLEALQARAGMRLRAGEIDEAIEDLQTVLTKDPTNQLVAQNAIQELVDRDRIEDALKLMTKALEAKPSEGLYRLRAILYRMEGKEDEAFADLNKAIAMQPKDPASLLQRAEVALARSDVKSAKADFKAALSIEPRIAGAVQGIFVRCLIAIEEKRMADAINDMKLLVSMEPDSIMRKIQLANLYLQDDRPRKAIESLSAVLDVDPTNVGILRSRGDAYLSVGDHAAAIEDYERAMKAMSDEDLEASGILNNLAWVLSTSPNDNVRDGSRAIDYAKRAAKLTEFKEAHILSTLAAAHAENGNFEKAIEWSTKAVELGSEEANPQLDQLKEELESYKQGKAWREKQETEENQVPILSPDDLIDT